MRRNAVRAASFLISLRGRVFSVFGPNRRNPVNAPDKLAQFIRLTREPLPASTKRYLQGSRPDIQVPVREILQSNGETVTVYDLSLIHI